MYIWIKKKNEIQFALYIIWSIDGKTTATATTITSEESKTKYWVNKKLHKIQVNQINKHNSKIAFQHRERGRKKCVSVLEKFIRYRMWTYAEYNQWCVTSDPSSNSSTRHSSDNKTTSTFHHFIIDNTTQPNRVVFVWKRKAQNKENRIKCKWSKNLPKPPPFFVQRNDEFYSKQKPQHIIFSPRFILVSHWIFKSLHVCIFAVSSQAANEFSACVFFVDRNFFLSPSNIINHWTNEPNKKHISSSVLSTKPHSIYTLNRYFVPEKAHSMAALCVQNRNW